MSSLAESIAEAREALAVYARKPRGSVLVHEDALPRLLAVAEAAVEMRKTYGKLASLHSVESGVPTFDLDGDGELVQTGRTPDIDKPSCEHCRLLAAFDAAGGQP